MGIGSDSHLRKVIVDKNARIGKNVQLLNREGIEESMDRMSQGLAIRCVLSRQATLSPVEAGYTLSPVQAGSTESRSGRKHTESYSGRMH